MQLLVCASDNATQTKDKTAQNDIDIDEVDRDTEMNGDFVATSRPIETGNRDIQPDSDQQSEPVGAAPTPDRRASSQASTEEQSRTFNITSARNNGESIGDKSDSEAETVVEEDVKEQKSSKAIKLEEVHGSDADVDLKINGTNIRHDNEREGSAENAVRKPSLKRKRVMLENGGGEDVEDANSSTLSSSISSPVQEARSSKATDSASNRSRSSPPPDEVAQGQARKSHKVRNGNRSVQSHQGGGKNDQGSAPVTGRKRRDTRSATHYEEPSNRSESPPSRHSNRAQSTQSNPSLPGVSKRRRAPAPLQVDRRRKASEDIHPESEDDSSVHSHHHLQKLTSADNNAMSPAKAVSHKKNRDRNGRTLLARACQQSEVSEVVKWLKERPQDVNVPDNAGNTPLQIAALDGNAEVIRLLLDAGCDIECKNIDKDTPLIDAVENGHLEVVEMLLKEGLDPRQTNAFGKEPLDLVPAKDEHADEIREALLASKREKSSLRRPSEDSNRQHGVSSREIEPTADAGSGESPVNSTRSPPPAAPGARRRTARSQPTDDALLWVNATPARLRDAAGKGQMTIVDHILKMRPEADTESILAAARGGHYDVLNLMLAVATHHSDPEPLRSSDYKPAYSTPMLATIGRGNINILNLLLAQPGFNPMRRLYNGMTYYELAKERQGSEWQEEYDILKEAYDNYKQNGGRKSHNNSPRKVRSKRTDSSKSGSEPSSSPHEARKTRKPNQLKEKLSNNAKEENFWNPEDPRHVNDLQPPDPSLDQGSEIVAPPRHRVRENAADDRYEHRTSKHGDGLKPKRRLMSGNNSKTDQDMKRRASLAAEAELPKRKGSDSLNDNARRRRFSEASESISQISPQEPITAENTVGKKRHRISVSPQATKHEDSGNSNVQRKKRQRADSLGNAVEKDDGRSFRPGAPAMVANMVANAASNTPSAIAQGTAPVAFMGSNVTSPVTNSPTELPPSSALSPMYSIDQAISRHPETEASQAQYQANEGNVAEEATNTRMELQDPIKETGAKQVEEERVRQTQAEVEEQARVQAEKDGAELRLRMAREEEARLEEQRQAAEAEEQTRLQREQEESRLAQLKRDEETQKRRVEQERSRKEEQERRRRESEERENVRLLRMQEEEARQRLQSLPNGLRRAAELAPEEAKDRKEITKWLPLRTVTTQELDPSCPAHVAEEKWISNIQAAPILAVTDLGLPQCKFPS